MKDNGEKGMGGVSTAKNANGENNSPLGGLNVEKSEPKTDQSVRTEMGVLPSGERRRSKDRDVVKTGYGN